MAESAREAERQRLDDAERRAREQAEALRLQAESAGETERKLAATAARAAAEQEEVEERAREAGFKQAVAERDSGQPIAPGRSKDFSDFGIR